MSKHAAHSEPKIFIIDADADAALAVANLARSSDHESQVYQSSQEFLQLLPDLDPNVTGCVVLELRLPDVDGLEIQRRLADHPAPLPLIFVAAHADTASIVKAMRSGAVAVLDKPLAEDDLWGFIQEGLAESKAEQKRRRHQRELESRFKRLSLQDRQVLQLILEGCKNRSMAKRLEVSLRTIENRRRRVFDVMQAESVAELTRMVVEYEHNLPPAEPADSGWMALPFERVA
jgi:two-component system response regulator FixJ